MVQAIKGMLDVLGLLQLLQSLNASRKTGVLPLDCPDIFQADVALHHGRIVHAVSGVLELFRTLVFLPARLLGGARRA